MLASEKESKLQNDYIVAIYVGNTTTFLENYRPEKFTKTKEKRKLQVMNYLNYMVLLISAVWFE